MEVGVEVTMGGALKKTRKNKKTKQKKRERATKLQSLEQVSDFRPP